MKYKRISENGSIHLVVTISLTLALLAALGWIFWQNFIYKTPVVGDRNLGTINRKETAEKQGFDEEYIPVIPTGWTTRTDSMTGVSYAMPDGWDNATIRTRSSNEKVQISIGNGGAYWWSEKDKSWWSDRLSDGSIGKRKLSSHVVSVEGIYPTLVYDSGDLDASARSILVLKDDNLYEIIRSWADPCFAQEPCTKKATYTLEEMHATTDGVIKSVILP